jgi:hypothetical protein
MNQPIDRLKWLRVRLGISDYQSAALARVSDYLLKAELREPDVWYQQDYRIASVMVAMAEQGRHPSYAKAFLQLFCKDASEVTWWWRDREKLFLLSELANRACPLALANRVQELLGGPGMVEIPDVGWVPLAKARAMKVKVREAA